MKVWTADGKCKWAFSLPEKILLVCIVFALIATTVVLSNTASSLSDASEASVEVRVLRDQNGLVFTVWDHWDMDSHRVRMFDFGWDDMPSLDIVAYWDKSEGGMRSFGVEDASLEEWSVWEARYVGIRRELTLHTSPPETSAVEAVKSRANAAGLLFVGFAIFFGGLWLKRGNNKDDSSLA